MKQNKISENIIDVELITEQTKAVKPKDRERGKLKAKYIFQKDEARKNFAFSYITEHIKRNLGELAKHKRESGGFVGFVDLERPNGKADVNKLP